METLLRGNFFLVAFKKSSDFLGSWINGNPISILSLLLVNLFSSDFLGSWINGNQVMSEWISTLTNCASDFLGSWINGNFDSCPVQTYWVCLLTSSEVELMETVTAQFFSVSPLCTSDFLGSWINGNPMYSSCPDVIIKDFWLPRKLN